MRKHVDLYNAKAVSLIKGVETEKGKFTLISSIIEQELDGIDVSVLSGANIASEVAEGQLCEATVGYKTWENGHRCRQLFSALHFHVNMVNDVTGVQLCGALKNVIALGAGFCDGLGLGSNTKSAIMRLGFAGSEPARCS